MSPNYGGSAAMMDTALLLHNITRIVQVSGAINSFTSLNTRIAEFRHARSACWAYNKYTLLGIPNYFHYGNKANTFVNITKLNTLSFSLT